MNELLVHLAGSQQAPGEVEPSVACPPIRYALFEQSQAVAEPGERAAGQAA